MLLFDFTTSPQIVPDISTMCPDIQYPDYTYCIYIYIYICIYLRVCIDIYIYNIQFIMILFLSYPDHK